MEHVLVSTRYNDKPSYLLQLLENAAARREPINFDVYGSLIKYVPEHVGKKVVRTNERPGKTVFNLWYACSECESPINITYNYCPQCGVRLEEDNE